MEKNLKDALTAIENSSVDEYHQKETPFVFVKNKLEQGDYKLFCHQVLVAELNEKNDTVYSTIRYESDEVCYWDIMDIYEEKYFNFVFAERTRYWDDVFEKASEVIIFPESGMYITGNEEYEIEKLLSEKAKEVKNEHK
jgi:hypothetical protein